MSDIDRMTNTELARELGLHLVLSDSGDPMFALQPEPSATAWDVVYDDVASAREAVRAARASAAAGRETK